MRDEVEVYRNVTRRRWSVRVGRWVAAHMDAIALRDVVFRSSEVSRLRTIRTGIRDVHAWARGVPVPGLGRPDDAVPVRYRPRIEPGFRDPDGGIVVMADFAWFEPDGTCWAALETFIVGAEALPQGRIIVTSGAPL
ncbi:hypothetical protein [Methylobacterium sp. J-092]|uniref:hypothetical protein n=1 Tax=Methylobacterium sp. J-092 TaxID=2836667 RepID=UPI001FB9BB68|nr:hypothetical protein [Methylobacterium sp. J-092]MCJ2007026.1 hypothetical protein [Methylobacterium sp. J-092]